MEARVSSVARHCRYHTRSGRQARGRICVIRLPGVDVRAGVAHESATYRAVEGPGHRKEDHILPTAMAGSGFDRENQRLTVRDRGSARPVPGPDPGVLRSAPTSPEEERDEDPCASHSESLTPRAPRRVLLSAPMALSADGDGAGQFGAGNRS
jgi:hypothetical protein